MPSSAGDGPVIDVESAFAPIISGAERDDPVAAVYVRDGLYASCDIDRRVHIFGEWTPGAVRDVRRASEALSALPQIPRFIVGHRVRIERSPEFFGWVEHQMIITWDGHHLQRWHLASGCTPDGSSVLRPGSLHLMSVRVLPTHGAFSAE